MNTENLVKLTYTQLKTFRNCRQKYGWKYHARVRPIAEEDANLTLGSAYHACQELYWQGNPLDEILAAADSFFPDRESRPWKKQDWNLCRAMMTAYYLHHQMHDRLSFSTRNVELEFEVPIINPATGAPSRTFCMGGKIDAVLDDTDGYMWLMEHKTASRVDANYLARLRMDFQIQLYAHYFEQTTGIKPHGIIYDVAQKYVVKQAVEESESEFQQRYAEACAKNKSGKSNITRQLAESDEAYFKRLSDKYAENSGEWFSRVELGISDFEIEQLEAEVWELAQQLLLCRRSGFWYKNTDCCMMYNRECEYLPLCMARHPENLIGNSFEIVDEDAVNPELVGETQKTNNEQEVIKWD